MTALVVIATSHLAAGQSLILPETTGDNDAAPFKRPNLAAEFQRLPGSAQTTLQSEFERRIKDLTYQRAKLLASGATAASGGVSKLQALNDTIASTAAKSLIVSNILNEPPPKPGTAVATEAVTISDPTAFTPELLTGDLYPSFGICAPGVWLPTGNAFSETVAVSNADIAKLALSVGRIDWYGVDNPRQDPPNQALLKGQPGGTVIAIAPDLVLTNKHVVGLMLPFPFWQQPSSSWPAAASWTLDPMRRFIISFPSQTGFCASPARPALFEAVSIVAAGELEPLANAQSDWAVLKVRPIGDAKVTPVMFDTDSSFSGDVTIGVIGYTARPSADDLTKYVISLNPTHQGLFRTTADLNAYFNLPNGKPDYLIERMGYSPVRDWNNPVQFGHFAPTLNSNSGSLIVNLQTHTAVGIHRGGSDDPTTVNLGLKASYVVGELTKRGVLEQGGARHSPQ